MTVQEQRTDRLDFRINPKAVISVQRVGDEQEPIITIDDVLAVPSALVDFAAHQVDFNPAGRSDGGYPGIRGPAPLPYVAQVVRAALPVMGRAFALDRVELAGVSCSFSIVTSPPKDLTIYQRSPHIDTVDPLQFALLHYLCDASLGGTSFYRHRATGYETLDDERAEAYHQLRAKELAEREPDAGYISGDTAWYQRIGTCEARFNRLVIYRSRLLHSGNIPAGAQLSSDPRLGRLTANIFVNLVHRGEP